MPNLSGVRAQNELKRFENVAIDVIDDRSKLCFMNVCMYVCKLLDMYSILKPTIAYFEALLY